jgi:hypothetical protein
MSHPVWQVLKGGTVEEDVEPIPSGQRAQAVHVIAVFMGDENGVQIFGRCPDRPKAALDLSGAQANIDEEADFRRRHVDAVPSGTAGKHRNF